MPIDLPERWVMAAAGRQHGLISTGQLAAAGFGKHAVAHRVRRGWLRRVHRGVYLVGPLETPHSRAMGAVLAYGDGALLGHEAAVVLRGFRPPPARALHVIVPGRDVRS